MGSTGLCMPHNSAPVPTALALRSSETRQRTPRRHTLRLGALNVEPGFNQQGAAGLDAVAGGRLGGGAPTPDCAGLPQAAAQRRLGPECGPGLMRAARRRPRALHCSTPPQLAEPGLPAEARTIQQSAVDFARGKTQPASLVRAWQEGGRYRRSVGLCAAHVHMFVPPPPVNPDGGPVQKYSLTPKLGEPGGKGPFLRPES